ncbi:extracellular solute-binding protein [Rickettsiales bacterium]|nr:extracellular solute-binding protein [Rickettsiales bacterium]
MKSKIFLLIIFLFVFFNDVKCNEINIYSARHYDSDIELYKFFTDKTGIKVNVVSGNAKALEKRIEEEGKDCKADLYIVADAGRLHSISEKGLLQNINSKILETKIPSHLRTDKWFAITKRARIFYYDPNRTSIDKIKDITYEDLANPKWNKKILIRASNNIYNQSLVASLIENNGIEKTREWALGLVKNMSRNPKGNDRAQILSVASGDGEIAVANTYYYALMLSGKKGKEQKRAAEKLKPLFPNQNERGAHINISGAGVLKNAKNKNNAIELLEFFLSTKAQKHIVNNTFEYPIIKGVEPHELIKKMGLSFKQDKTNVSSFGKHQANALKIMTQAGWK